MMFQDSDIIPPQHRWFSVDEFLPPDEHVVLCIWHYFDIYTNQWVQYQADGIYTDSGWAQYSDIHLWNPDAVVIKWTYKRCYGIL